MIKKTEEQLERLNSHLSIAFFQTSPPFLFSIALWKQAEDFFVSNAQETFPFFCEALQSVGKLLMQAKQAEEDETTFFVLPGEAETVQEVFEEVMSQLTSIQSFVREMIHAEVHRPLKSHEQGSLWDALLQDLSYVPQATEEMLMDKQRKQFDEELTWLESQLKIIKETAPYFFSRSYNQANRWIENTLDCEMLSYFSEFLILVLKKLNKIFLGKDALKDRGLILFFAYLTKGSKTLEEGNRCVKQFLSQALSAVCLKENQQAFSENFESDQQAVFVDLVKNKNKYIEQISFLITHTTDVVFIFVCTQAIVFFLFIEELNHFLTSIEIGIQNYRTMGLVAFANPELRVAFFRGINQYHLAMDLLLPSSELTLMGDLDDEKSDEQRCSSPCSYVSPSLSSRSSVTSLSSLFEHADQTKQEDKDLWGVIKPTGFCFKFSELTLTSKL